MSELAMGCSSRNAPVAGGPAPRLHGELPSAAGSRHTLLGGRLPTSQLYPPQLADFSAHPDGAFCRHRPH